MENDEQIVDVEPSADPPEREPKVVFYAYPLEMWFWRIAVPAALIISLIALFK